MEGITRFVVGLEKIEVRLKEVLSSLHVEPASNPEVGSKTPVKGAAGGQAGRKIGHFSEDLPRA